MLEPGWAEILEEIKNLREEIQTKSRYVENRARIMEEELTNPRCTRQRSEMRPTTINHNYGDIGEQRS